jgi:hypothetical protein
MTEVTRERLEAVLREAKWWHPRTQEQCGCKGRPSDNLCNGCARIAEYEAALAASVAEPDGTRAKCPKCGEGAFVVDGQDYCLECGPKPPTSVLEEALQQELTHARTKGGDDFDEEEEPEHQLLPRVHPQGSWGCRCGITVSYADNLQDALIAYREHVAERAVAEKAPAPVDMQVSPCDNEPRDDKWRRKAREILNGGIFKRHWIAESYSELEKRVADGLVMAAAGNCKCVCHEYPEHMNLQDALEALKWHQQKLAAEKAAPAGKQLEKWVGQPSAPTPADVELRKK